MNGRAHAYEIRCSVAMSLFFFKLVPGGKNNYVSLKIIATCCLCIQAKTRQGTHDLFLYRSELETSMALYL